MHAHVKQDSILEFWFGDQTLHPLANASKWFSKSAEFDDQVRARFGSWLDDTMLGAFDDWAKTPTGALALVVLCDQFPRQIFRGDERAFGFDAKALRTSQIAIANGFDKKLSVIQRLFLYLPFEHSESLDMQSRSVELFEDLLTEAHGDEIPYIKFCLDYAVRHYDVIKAYGRFPHRNSILGRETTAEEKEFLKRPGSAF